MDRADVLKMKTCVTSIPEVVRIVSKWGKEDDGRYICVSNVHMCMEVFDDGDYASIVNRADVVIADGKPIFWAQKLLGHRNAKHVRGEDLVLSLCANAEQEKIIIGFYGSTSDVLNDLESRLLQRYPNLQIGCKIAPPFNKMMLEEELGHLSAISKAGVDILFVGLGCPKQERWIAEHKTQVKCTMIGVGAAFDFISGNKRHAPRWLQYMGLEWLFRLLSEPRRLWKRYLKHNPRFLFYFLGQLAGIKYR